MNQHAGLATWTFPGAKPKWLFHEAAELKAELEATHPAQRYRTTALFLDDNRSTTPLHWLYVMSELGIEPCFVYLQNIFLKKGSPQHCVIFKGKIMM